MVSAQSASDVFVELMNDESNRVCFDCGGEAAVFASVSYGIFICQRCSVAHQLLGKDTSFVKGLNAEWSLKQLKLMTLGGNSELKAFFDIYGIPGRAPPEYKYNTLAARYYRERLLCNAQGINYEAPQPSPEEGLAMIRHPAPAPEPQASSGGISGFFSSAFSTVKSAGMSVVSKAQEITQDPRVKVWEERALSALSTAGTAVKTGAEWTLDRGRDLTENSTFQSAVSTVKSTASSAASKVGEIATYSYESFTSNPHVQEVSNGAKRKLEELEQKVRSDASSIYVRIAGPTDERPNTPPEYR